MIKLTQNTPTGGDCTARYTVTLDKEYTVKEFIDEVLTRNEWGCVGIYNEGQAWFDSGTPNCEYSRGKLITEMPLEVLERKIESVTASGGWSRMDYVIKL